LITTYRKEKKDAGDLFRKIAFIMLLLLGLGMLSPDSRAAYSAMGQPAPPFEVKSGQDQKLTLEMIIGKVVVLFYETRQVVDKNDDLKDELIRLYQDQPENIQKEIFRLVVIDCSQATLPTQAIWKHKLAQHSLALGFTIYGDWNRKMLLDYGLERNDSNFLIIDKNGIIRYSSTGKINNGEIKNIKNLLISLAH
jgi:alkyl hydroperoxide reductase subunit AhpC